MSRPFVHYLGSPAEVGHHAAPLRGHLEVAVAPVDEVLRQACPGDVAVLCSEHFEQHREAVEQLRQRRIATVYAIDGILEWRNAWQNMPDERACPWTMRPCLSDKVAVIGPSQARVLAAWGNAQRLELIGVPRFDAAASKRPDFATMVERLQSRPSLKVLVVTAKCPGFTPEQIETTQRSLAALSEFFDHSQRRDKSLGHPPRWEVVWRLTSGMEQRLGVRNTLAELTGADLATQLDQVDLVVSTASTVMLEGMLAGRPVAQLDFHNVPELVPAAWRIGASEQIEPTLESMRLSDSIGVRRLAWQENLLADALWSRPDATERMARLLTELHRLAVDRVQSGATWSFPSHLVPCFDASVAEGERQTVPGGQPIAFENLYPEYPDLQRDDLGALRSELAQARREIAYLRSHLQEAHGVLERLQRFPFVRGAIGFGARWSAWREQRHRTRATPAPLSRGSG